MKEGTDGAGYRLRVFSSPRARHCAIGAPCAVRVACLPSEPRPKGERGMVGLSRFELLTPRLSSVCSNQLSYRPLIPTRAQSPVKEPDLARGRRKDPILSKLDRTCAHSHEYQIDLFD
jgi:hypothetical protein